MVDRFATIGLDIGYAGNIATRKQYALRSVLAQCTRVTRTQFVVRHELRTESDRVRGEVVFMVDVDPAVFDVSRFHQSLVADATPESGRLAPAVFQHPLEVPNLPDPDVAQFTNGGAAEKLMPLLGLARQHSEQSARDVLREIDALFGTADAWDRAALQTAFQKARANGEQEYVAMLEEWVNRRVAAANAVQVTTTGVSFLYDVEQFDNDRRFCANRADSHRTYKKGDFAPEVRIRSLFSL